MRLLVISNNPERASFRQRIGIYLDSLCQAQIDCEVAQLPSGATARWKLFGRCKGFDGVFVHKKRFNPLDTFWLRRCAKKIIYDFDDAVMYTEKKPEIPSRKRLKSFERTVRLADLVIAGNTYLAQHARAFNNNVEILPTGLDTGAYKIKRITEDGKIRLVWIGSKSTLRYLNELKPALEQIGSRFDNVVLRIIADEFLDLERMEVEKRPWSLQTQAADLVNSDIGLAPLPDDPFTRGKCGFKILQYTAAFLPTVASPVGVNAEYVIDTVTGFLASDSAQWVDRIKRLLLEPDLRSAMKSAAKEQVVRFDKAVLGKRIVKLVLKCLASQ
jgi:glycosyltransferase involved in cell wall biosynthesis